MVERQAADLHLMAGLKPALRIQGEIVPLDDMERLTPDTLHFRNALKYALPQDPGIVSSAK